MKFSCGSVGQVTDMGLPKLKPSNCNVVPTQKLKEAYFSDHLNGW